MFIVAENTRSVNIVVIKQLLVYSKYFEIHYGTPKSQKVGKVGFTGVN